MCDFEKKFRLKIIDSFSIDDDKKWSILAAIKNEPFWVILVLIIGLLFLVSVMVVGMILVVKNCFWDSNSQNA